MAYLLKDAGGRFTLNAGGFVLINAPATGTGPAGGTLADLGKKKPKKPLSHISSTPLGGERVFAAGSRARQESLMAEIERRRTDDEHALITILSHL